MSQLEAPQHKYGTARSVLLQFTSILCMANGGIASAALKSYTDDRNTAASYGSVLTNTDAQAGAALTITAGALVGSLLTILYIVHLVYPGHRENRTSVKIKEALLVGLTLFFLAATLTSTIVTASHGAILTTTGLSASMRSTIVSQLSGGHLKYHYQSKTLAYTIIDWICFLLMIVTSLYVSKAARHVLTHGPEQAPPQFPERMARKYFGKYYPAAPGEAELLEKSGPDRSEGIQVG